jgi:hypothetical protein
MKRPGGRDCKGRTALVGSTEMAGKSKMRKRKWLLGLGLDGRDGHVRVTTGENFKLVGGSEDTHASMQEKAIKMNEQLKRRGKTLETISREEFYEIADKLQMPLLDAMRVPRKN